MKNSILNRDVSIFANYKDTTPKTVSLSTFLTSDKHAAKITALRQHDDKAQRDAIKATLPAITPSGTFTHRAESGLIEHSGFIQADIDAKDNPMIFDGADTLAECLDNLSVVKSELSKLKNLAYIGLSASGRGLFILIPIAYPDRHKEHFASLVADFKKIGINLDTAPSNVASLRGYSYDPDAYFNHNAEIYTRLATPEKKAPTSQSQPTKHSYPVGSEADKVKFILEQIARQSADITAGYQNWFAIGCALANEFGESGRGYFHDVSRYNSGYDYRQADTQFTHCLKGTAYTIATFYTIAAQHGFTFKEAFQKPENATRKEPATNARNDSQEHHTAPTGTPQATPEPKTVQTAPTTPANTQTPTVSDDFEEFCSIFGTDKPTNAQTPTVSAYKEYLEDPFMDSPNPDNPYLLSAPAVSPDADWWNIPVPKPQGWVTTGQPQGWVIANGVLNIVVANLPDVLSITPVGKWLHLPNGLKRRSTGWLMHMGQQ